ncbi:FliH/SctL family protein [Opitutus sp. ER46]|uniref:FliH/SctL family protein n=1 Tax=Opitutus sp. ER46 TaxID=2161864 RepID=UPI000D31C198|nr:FliH/SctL family protein [Opitutus sp. ER46]PTX90898.1 flagellar biosynthesis protein [Opitutus sp. ER46]
MAFARLIAFDRPLAGVAVPGKNGRFLTEQEIAALEEAAYRRGVDETRALADQQLVDFRADIQRVGDGIFHQLANFEPTLVAQLREALPELALDIARRLLAGCEPSAEMVSRICEEALKEIFPERENLELLVSARDAELLQKLNPDWLQRYPGLRLRADPTLSPGDCQVRSRFGLTDARIESKLDALKATLSPAF